MIAKVFGLRNFLRNPNIKAEAKVHDSVNTFMFKASLKSFKNFKQPFFKISTSIEQYLINSWLKSKTAFRAISPSYHSLNLLNSLRLKCSTPYNSLGGS